LPDAAFALGRAADGHAFAGRDVAGERGLDQSPRVAKSASSPGSVQTV
jgi:hypothetical protein